MKSLYATTILGAFALSLSLGTPAQAEATMAQKKDALATYAKIADMSYSHALADAKTLQAALHALAKAPSEATLKAAKAAWLASRESYGPTEVFRLSGGPIDAESGWVAKAYGNLEGQINAWPLDENMIDYTRDADGQTTHGNIIDTAGKFTPSGEDASAVDVSKITPAALTALNENGGDANVATGYHAIEFLLWGQDQDYANMIEDKVTHGAKVAGQRPLSDFTTAPHAQRRLAFLTAAGDKLVADLARVSAAWAPEIDGDTGLYRAAFLGQLTGAQKDRNIPTEVALKQVLAGVGVFTKSELANERIAVAVLTPSEEDEHSCFSDNTHRDIALNYQGVRNVLMGEYGGRSVGPAFFGALPKAEQASLTKLIGKIEGEIKVVNDTAKTKMHFDYQIHPENTASVQNIVTLKNNLRRLGDQMTKVAPEFGVSLTTDEVTDPEETKVN